MAKNTRNNPENLSFEEALKRLEKIVSDLEGGATPLDKSMELYEEGMKLSKFCLTTLDSAEAKLKKLVRDMNGNFEIKDID
jgi:exodeoxyribonuclease VII small subunit